MKLNVYLPDDIGARAKAAELNFSGFLRSAIEQELYRLDALAKLEDGMTEHELELEDDDGNNYIGTLIGKQLAEDVYLTDDDRLIWYDTDKLRYWEIQNPEEELKNLPQEDYVTVLHALGLKPRIAI